MKKLKYFLLIIPIITVIPSFTVDLSTSLTPVITTVMLPTPLLISNNKKGVALHGYDVVAYFQNHENNINKGKRGLQKFSSKYQDITYYFSSQNNKELFEAKPEQYIPAYGGWCAWAMSYGKSGVPVNYDTFLIAPDLNGNKRLFLFYNSWGNNTLKKWKQQDHITLVKQADATWAKELQKEAQ